MILIRLQRILIHKWIKKDRGEGIERLAQRLQAAAHLGHHGPTPWHMACAPCLPRAR